MLSSSSTVLWCLRPSVPLRGAGEVGSRRWSVPLSSPNPPLLIASRMKLLYEFHLFSYVSYYTIYIFMKTLHFCKSMKLVCVKITPNLKPIDWWSSHFYVNVPVILTLFLSELIRTVDGGQISLDWVDNQASVPYPKSSTRPTVLILPGLTGNSQQSYVLHAIRQATRRGYRSVVFLTHLLS